MTVLIVDDFSPNRKFVSAVLSHESFIVREAEDGIGALEILEHEPIDAIISDILMPNMDGYRLCKEVRRSEKLRDVPFIFYTSTYTSPSDEALALELGADKFIRKPARGAFLVEAVRELVGGPRRIHAAIAPQAELDLTTEYTKRLVEKLEEKNEELSRRTEELRETNEKLQAVICAAPVAIMSFDQVGRVRSWNPAAERIFGWSEAEVLGQRPLHVGARDHEDFERLRQRVHAGETIVGLEVRRSRRDGTEVDLELNAAPIKDADGNIVGKLAVLADITERKRAGELVARSRDFHKALFDDFPALIWQSGTDAKCCYFNRTWLEFTGRALDDELGDGWMQGVHPDDLEKTAKSYFDAFHARRPFEIEYRLRRRDGEYRDILDHGRPFSDPEGHFGGYVGSCYDITDRKLAAARLARSEALMAEAQALAHIGSWDWDIPAKIVIWSDELYRMMGLRPQERPVSYDFFLSLVHPEDRDRVDRTVRQALADHGPLEYECHTALASGVSRTYHVKGIVSCDEENRPLRIHGTMQDITEQSMAKEALRQSEQLFAAFMDNLPAYAWMKDMEGRYVYANQRTKRLPEYQGDWSGKTDADLWPAEIAAAFRANDLKVIDSGEAMQAVEDYLAEGEVRHTLASKFPIFDEKGQIVMVGGASVDITERKRAEQQVENFGEMLKILTNRLFEMQEEERRHIARELHDEIGQSLTAAKLDIEAAMQLDRPSERDLRLGDGLAVIEHLIQSVRALSLDLRPALLDEIGLAAALSAHAQAQAARGGLALRLVVDKSLPRCDPAVEIACFRVAQEALTNILRHARATRVEIELCRRGDELQLQVRDNGTGFDMEAANARVAGGASFGLLSMRERVHLTGGRFVCQSAPGQGTEIEAYFLLAMPGIEDRYEKAARNSGG